MSRLTTTPGGSKMAPATRATETLVTRYSATRVDSVTAPRTPSLLRDMLTLTVSLTATLVLDVVRRLLPKDARGKARVSKPRLRRYYAPDVDDALARIANRPTLLSALTPAQIAAFKNESGPEVMGRGQDVRGAR
jgi:hypothetical protein